MLLKLQESLQPHREQLLKHPLYTSIKSPEDLRIFMRHHVFAVWDFMSLLKALQVTLTRTTTPWVPVASPNIRYLINEIVLAEETDLNKFGERQSHFEMYLDAMRKANASVADIEEVVAQVKHGTDIFLVIAMADLPVSVKKFLQFTFSIIEEGKPHKIAAAFTFGREDLIPDLFHAIIEKLQAQFPKEQLDLVHYYFERHIELDGDEHGPMALDMVSRLCGEDETRWEEAQETAIKALELRKVLWDGIAEAIKESDFMPTGKHGAQV
ncbi:DUF3050 domain-containing protein [Croceiramulus getboli]|nr:DUF3050 domain-containing protein [Flavobacteriaceae bacterium YJPT1-3]